MRIAIVGPQESVRRVKSVIMEKVPFVECIEAVYVDLPEIPPLLRQCQNSVDGVLFTGQTPFQLACLHVNATTPWEYLPRNMTSTLCALIQAGYLNGYDIRRISADGFAANILEEVYHEIGFVREELNIYSCPVSVSEKSYYQKVANFHYDLYQTRRVSLCITGLSEVYRLLKSRDVPIVKVSANAEIITEKVNQLRLIHEISTSEENRIAVVVVKIQFCREHSFSSQSEMQRLQLENKLSEAVYQMATKMGAAIVRQASGYYHLFSTKHSVEKETQSFQRLPLLRHILSINRDVSVSVGIGLGKNASEAKRNAELGSKKAERYDVACFVIDENNQITGPITEGLSERQEAMIDRHLYLISKKTAIGMNTLNLLEQVQKQYALDDVTPSELARLCGCSLRTMNRILMKLEDAGYAVVVGKEPTCGPGRPSRVIRLYLTEEI